MSLHVCQVCGQPIPVRSSPGRPRRYCSGRCRTEAYRLRQAEAFDAGLPGPQPRPDAYLRAELLEVADSLITADAKATPEEQLARAVIESRTLASAFDRLAGQLPPALSWRASTMAAQISTTLKKLFGGAA